MPLALVTLVSQRDEEFAGWRWYFRIEGEQFAVDVNGPRPAGAQRVYELLDRDAGVLLEVAADRERGEHDGQVGLDGVTLAMEHRPGTEGGLGHSERPPDLPPSRILGCSP